MNKTIKNFVRALMNIRIPVPGFIKPLGRAFYLAGVWMAEAWPLILKFIWIEPVLRSVCAHVGRRLRVERMPYMRGTGRLSFGDDVHLSGRSCFYFMRTPGSLPEIEIGNHVFIGNQCTLSAAQRIKVGDHVLISSSVRIYDNDGHPLDAAKRMAGDKIGADAISPVMIGAGAWIGVDAIILKGVTIGERAVIGAGAVVTGDIPADCVAAGNPARVVKEMRNSTGCKVHGSTVQGLAE